MCHSKLHADLKPTYVIDHSGILLQSVCPQAYTPRRSAEQIAHRSATKQAQHALQYDIFAKGKHYRAHAVTPGVTCVLAWSVTVMCKASLLLALLA